MQELKLYEDVFDELDHGKRCTIRKGDKNISLGPIKFVSDAFERTKYCEVWMVYKCKLKHVMVDDLISDGFESHSNMIDEMKRFYPDITSEDYVTVIKFK